MNPSPCEFCGNDIPFELEQCPHCGRSGPPPNVKAASAAAERQALDRRYQAVLQDSTGRGWRETVEAFEAASQASKAVISCPLAEAERIATSDRQLYGTYYKRLDAGVQAPHGNEWDRWRQMADVTLFPLTYKEIRFAALSLEGVGVRNYGECSFVLREKLIADRASVFEDNSAVFLRDRHYKLEPGHRALWEERSKLCVAKLATWVEGTTEVTDFPDLLLHQGATREDDRFVEVHIWGPLTVRTVERAILTLEGRKPGQAARKALKARLAASGVDLEVR